MASCSQVNKQHAVSTNCLPDSLFVAQASERSINLSALEIEDNFNISYKGSKLTPLSSEQKIHLLGPFITNGFAPTDFTAHFVSKQQKMGNLQPITLRVLGTDYLAHWLVLLDDQCNPVSRFYLEGEGCEGPSETDSTMMDCPTKQNRFSKNAIESCEIRQINYTDGTGRKIIDSLFYRTTISDSGELKTLLVDSIRTIQ